MLKDIGCALLMGVLTFVVLLGAIYPSWPINYMLGIAILGGVLIAILAYRSASYRP